MAIITISRAAFSGVEALAEALAGELGYRLYSREELLSDAAREFNALQSELESALIHKPGLLEGRGLKRLRFVQCARATIAKAVRADDMVYHGEAGHLLLGPLAHHLRVRAVVPNDARVANAMARCDMTRERATRYVAELDEKRSHWVKWMHGVDMNDPHSFDLMVNLGRIPAPSAMRLIVDTVRRDFRTTPGDQGTGRRGRGHSRRPARCRGGRWHRDDPHDSALHGRRIEDRGDREAGRGRDRGALGTEGVNQGRPKRCATPAYRFSPGSLSAPRCSRRTRACTSTCSLSSSTSISGRSRASRSS